MLESLVLPAKSMFDSYTALALGLHADLNGICLVDASARSWGEFGELHEVTAIPWIRSLGLFESAARAPTAQLLGGTAMMTAIPLEHTDGTLLGIFCVSQPLSTVRDPAPLHASRTAGRMNPLLDCVRRDMIAATPVKATGLQLTERTAELEWLFKVTNRLKGAVDDQRVLEELLSAATIRLGGTLGILSVPDKRLVVRYEADKSAARPLLDSWAQTAPHLLTWAQRQNRPLVNNRIGRGRFDAVWCKVLCVPIVRESGRVVGIMAFYNPHAAPDFQSRQVFLARHIGRQAASIIEAQFDLMTGLYTRAGLDQTFACSAESDALTEQSVLYIDIDHMHVANELHGFELGNELIVRVADLLSPPILPESALAARIAGDRFAIVLPESGCDAAVEIAEKLRTAASQLVIGPSKDMFDVSISCGVSILLPMSDGLARAIAAAEIACKTAKQRGRNRVELYAFEDGTMMRRHSDALAVGQLRSALKADRLLLYAQRIAPLQDPALPGGYELLLRLQDADGTLLSPGPLIEAAQRYQILPSIDRWVIQRALRVLAPYRSMLLRRELGMSINVSGQSISDETFIDQLCGFLKEANLPPNCVSVELTEQAAITNISRATQMVSRLRALGCRMALDDFGTGANSLSYLKSLQVYRVKIDGSFVRDILTNRNSQATVRAIVELARSMSIETVAEYVESPEIAREVKALGVDFAQGYAYGKPEPLAGVLKAQSRDDSQRWDRLYLES